MAGEQKYNNGQNVFHVGLGLDLDKTVYFLGTDKKKGVNAPLLGVNSRRLTQFQ